MTNVKIHNTNITDVTPLRTPKELKTILPVTSGLGKRVAGFRSETQRILCAEDHRLLAIVGPCSIHDPKPAGEYARLLKALADELQDTLLILMRAYFEKPRTSIGWKGLINDPRLDGSFRINEGLFTARKFLLDLADLGLPVATEALDPVTPQYLGDLVTWTAVGARTSESQPHREMASGLSTPVGFKNSTSGLVTSAVHAVTSARQPHHFFGITQRGQIAVYHTLGNHCCHVILRGGVEPNYGTEHVRQCEEALAAEGLPLNIMIDCSHGNSQKDPSQQRAVLDNCVRQIEEGNGSIFGFMLESNLLAGKQVLPEDLSQLAPGRSITDPCIDWPTTVTVLQSVHRRLRKVLPGRNRLERNESPARSVA